MANTLPEPSFIERDPQKILDEQVAFYEAQIGKKLEPAQIEQLLINNWAYRENTVRNQFQAGCLQMLVDFATFPNLDYLGRNVGVDRLAPSSAEVDIEFALVPGHGSVVIPAGLRVQSSDGLVVFELMEDVSVGVGVDVATGRFAAQIAGANGNGYAIGAISIILDPQAYLSTAENTNISAGGSDEESDEELRSRIKLAPSAFSTAGPKPAYRFWVKSAHPSIIDVGVMDKNDDVAIPAGQVNIYPLSSLGTPTPSGVLDAVTATLTAEKVKPLNDVINVASPTVNSYDIEVDITALSGSDTAALQSEIEAALLVYANERKSGLGKDIVIGRIRSICFKKNTYDAVVTSPATDIVSDQSEINVCGTITVNIVGTEDE